MAAEWCKSEIKDCDKKSLKMLKFTIPQSCLFILDICMGDALAHCGRADIDNIRNLNRESGGAPKSGG